jgi:two-component sensor histidine kinase
VRKNITIKAALLMFVISSLLVILMSLYSHSIVGFLMEAMEENIEGRLKETSKRGVSLVTHEELAMFREPADMISPPYQELRLKLKDFATDADVKYIYYMRIEGDMLQYIVDNDFDERTRVGLDTPLIDVSVVPGLKYAIAGQFGVAPLGVYMDNWEGLMSAYAPIFDSEGKVAAICGVDINDELVFDARNRTQALLNLQVISVTIVFLCGLFCLIGYSSETKAAMNANQSKSAFLSKVSHEMRTPLAVMSANAQLAYELLKNNMEGKEVFAALDAVKNEAARLARMSDATIALGITQCFSDSMDNLDVGDIIVKTAEVYRTLVERKGNKLSLNVPDDLPYIKGSADGLSQVLINLISNANEHTEHGELNVAASRERGAITVAVKDTGEGITQEHLDGIFTRKPVSDSKRKAGGIGLSICREIVEKHGGKIWITSRSGEGTVVSFTLPTRGE